MITLQELITQLSLPYSWQYARTKALLKQYQPQTSEEAYYCDVLNSGLYVYESPTMNELFKSRAWNDCVRKLTKLVQPSKIRKR